MSRPSDYPLLPAGVTIQDALVALTAHLQLAGIEGAAVDVRRLLAHALGGDSLDLIRDPNRKLSNLEVEHCLKLIARRAKHEPVSRIIGLRGFFGREFVVTPATLDPRPETETLIELALELARFRHRQGHSFSILDIGTGSGAILITLLAELPFARGIGTDVSRSALEVARINSERLAVAQRCRWLEGRTFAGEAGPFDLVVSNPPYIPTHVIGQLEPDVRDFDPHLALDGGADGLDIYREIASGLSGVIPHGAAVVEVGVGQAADVAHLFADALTTTGETTIAFGRDLGGIERCVSIATQF